MTMMPVVSADGRAWRPLSVLPGKNVPYRYRVGSGLKTVADFLPNKIYIYMRKIAGVDTDTFKDWSSCFVTETEQLRK